MGAAAPIPISGHDDCTSTTINGTCDPCRLAKLWASLELVTKAGSISRSCQADVGVGSSCCLLPEKIPYGRGQKMPWQLRKTTSITSVAQNMPLMRFVSCEYAVLWLPLTASPLTRSAYNFNDA